jgi:MscS family membrane protein
VKPKFSALLNPLPQSLTFVDLQYHNPLFILILQITIMQKLFLTVLIGFLTLSPLLAQQPDSLPQDTLPDLQALQDSLARETAEIEGEDLSSFSLENPRLTVNSHIHFLQRDSYEPRKSAQTLMAPEMSEEEKEELARMLIQIYDGEGFFVEIEDIPNKADYKDSTGRHRYIIFDKYPDIYVQKYGDYWFYSRRSVRTIPSIHEKVYPYGSDLIATLIPGYGDREVLGLSINQWAGILILLLAAYLVYRVLNLLLALFLKRVLPMFFKEAYFEISDIYPVARPLSWLVVTLLLTRLVPILQLDIAMNQYVIISLRILGSVFGILLASRIIDLVAKVAVRLASKTDTTMDDQLIPLVVRIIRMIVIVFGIIFILQNLGVNVTALLAGVSIGGLALALAAQDTVKNFIGSISIFIDRPFQIADFIETSTFTGTVEEVGVRSTRIRDLGGALISIPNGNLVNQTVTNHSTRTHRRYATELTVTYSTSTEQMLKFVEAVRQIAENYEFTKEDSVTVQFKGFANSSLNIFLAVSFTQTAFADMLIAQQTINLEIMKKADELGVEFAFPSTSLYVESLPQDAAANRFLGAGSSSDS